MKDKITQAVDALAAEFKPKAPESKPDNKPLSKGTDYLLNYGFQRGDVDLGCFKDIARAAEWEQTYASIVEDYAIWLTCTEQDLPIPEGVTFKPEADDGRPMDAIAYDLAHSGFFYYDLTVAKAVIYCSNVWDNRALGDTVLAARRCLLKDIRNRADCLSWTKLDVIPWGKGNPGGPVSGLS